MPIAFPGETDAYRAARAELLKHEVALRGQIETVARMRRALPDGGKVSTEYVFTAPDGVRVALGDLFTRDSGTLMLYSLMFRPDADDPCPMCVSMLDGLDGQAEHVGQRVDLAIVAAATPRQLADLSARRGWDRLRLLSTQGTSYQVDYHAETPEGAQLPMMNVFRKTADGIRHFWGSEGFFADVGGQPRHVDLIWPLWNMLDLTPDGRGDDWYPALTYA